MIRSFSAILSVACVLIASNPAFAQDRPATKLPPPGEKFEIKPLPPVAIPDDPPPHEGAMVDIPMIIDAPDILVVEVLEALPGCPITGERLVRPDGTISLGFYGDPHVRGLSVNQAKIKIINHLRTFLNDEILGLIEPVVEGEVPGVDMPMPPGGRSPFEKRLVPPPADEKKPEEDLKPPEARSSRPSAFRLRTRSRVAVVQRTSQLVAKPPVQDKPPKGDPGLKPAAPADQDKAVAPPDQGMNVVVVREVPIAPENSIRVFVDVAAYNSKVYYVQGDVGVPGRLPFTGQETVLDALNYAGGFVATAEPTDIHLYRPARGGKPAKDYKIDHAAILRGVAEANLQLFPNDRLVVGRNPIVKRAVELDRAAAPINSVMNSILQYGFTARTMGSLNIPLPGASSATANTPSVLSMTPAERDAKIKEWAEFFYSITDKDKGAMLDEKAFKEALMKKLTPAPEPKKE